jgi:hypothetical protein
VVERRDVARRALFGQFSRAAEIFRIAAIVSGFLSASASMSACQRAASGLADSPDGSRSIRPDLVEQREA